ncbi:DUF1127 domain-containing protein [Oceanicella actignis]|uniref:DUF1127 domain-containing protein n=1 Tax=Oceanicella actignis TaxID=1189325 RepID=UPI00125A6D3C|nr:DUF1127 domain-containing protein [Oceanicella actignis]TYO88527.1 uncharacterized protein DUF1127 [Oceanicella actignis]
MAIAPNAPVAPFGAIAALRIVTAVESAIASVHAHLRRRRTIAALRRLTPTQLADIGFADMTIEEIAETLNR